MPSIQIPPVTGWPATAPARKPAAASAAPVPGAARRSTTVPAVTAVTTSESTDVEPGGPTTARSP